MTTIYPLAFRWSGEAMEPLHPKRADEQYVVGEVYRLVPHEERSEASHRAYFASINEAWSNLPEDQSARWPTPDHLRRWALIKAGYCDERTLVASSKAEALRLAAFIKPMDGYAIVTVSEAVVKVYTARSQSYRAMGKAEFQASKQKVLDIVAGLIDVTADQLRRAGETA